MFYVWVQRWEFYKQCQKFIEEWQLTTDNSSVPRKVFANRGVIIADYKSE